jgi:hypothetical protein
MRYENGSQVDMESIISNCLEKGEKTEIPHIWVILKEDLALMEAEAKQQR